MSQREEPLFDYKDRPIGEAYMLADGGISLDFVNYNSIILLNKDSTDRIFKLIEDDRRERK
jgi:hypothetical protein